MKRLGVVVGVLLAFAAATAHAPAPAGADACSPDGDCTKPDCITSINARAGMTRRVLIRCERAVSARLIDQPAHGTITNLAEVYGSKIYVDLHMDADAPAHDSATFAVATREQTVDVTLGIDLLPASQNSPPVCQGDTSRIPFSAQVMIMFFPHCVDPDGDDFT